jgi:hypothetical protein
MPDPKNRRDSSGRRRRGRKAAAPRLPQAVAEMRSEMMARMVQLMTAIDAYLAERTSERRRAVRDATIRLLRSAAHARVELQRMIDRASR